MAARRSQRNSIPSVQKASSALPRYVAAVVALLTALAIGWLAVESARHDAQAAERATKPGPSPLDAARAMGYLEAICRLGPRPSGSPGMAAQQKLATEHFEKLGARVHRQSFRIRDPRTGAPIDMTNLIVQWHPRSRDRVLLAAHYDTRPFPDRDPVDPTGAFLGANDGASGVALLMELGHLMPRLTEKVGVDFVLFDGEEFVFADTDRYFYGSEYFAGEYVSHPPEWRYRAAVVLDMVGDADLQIFREQYTLSWEESRPLLDQLWQTAKRLGVREFYHQVGPAVRDDHLALRNIGRIPSCDIIDFEYPAWHTRADLPQRCSGESLAKVGHVVWQWLQSQR